MKQARIRGGMPQKRAILATGRHCYNNHMDAPTLTAQLKSLARDLGFVLSGACPAVSPWGVAPLADWLEAGYAGEMAYLANRMEAYDHPSQVLTGARSLLMLGMSYRTVAPATNGLGEGRVSRYAWGAADYHDVIHQRLKKLSDLARRRVPGVQVRGVVDTAPLLEREFAQLAGLGWVGKNTLLINRRFGSWFFLAALLLDCELDYDEPFVPSHCGTCTACLDACPTQALPQPFVLDATRCISYLTIELQGSVPLQHRAAIGDWLFGCDICQEVCPWNHKATTGDDTFSPVPHMNPVQLHRLFQLDDDAFRRQFRRTPLWRARRRGLLRNAAIVLGNQGHPTSRAALALGLHDHEPIVRGASAWALGQLAGPETTHILRTRCDSEPDPDVRAEIQRALQRCAT